MIIKPVFYNTAGTNQSGKNVKFRVFKGLLDNKLREDPSGELHFTDICKAAGMGGTPYRDGSYEYYVNEPRADDDFKGVGPFILASMEQEAPDSQ